MKKKTVFVGLSGGVDSGVSAALLQKQGFNVVAVFIKTWHPDFLECNEEEERRDAMRIAAHLNIPFLTFDFEKEYKKSVGDYMIEEYRKGRTPNPDVMCNKEIKFGAFLKKAISMGADYVATGHYAKTEVVKNSTAGRFRAKHGGKAKNFLLRGIDPSKDQSYFLWTLNQDQLSKILFPIGHLKKSQVRVLAKRYKLPVASKKDSQGICFLGTVDIKEFLSHYIEDKKGKVLNEHGEEIGYHHGATFFTLGERHGFTITKKTPNDKRYYIVAKDIKKNTITVNSSRNVLEKSLSQADAPRSSLREHAQTDCFSREFSCENMNWISEKPKENKKYTAQIRYHGESLPCTVKDSHIVFEKPVLVASGQSIVLYDGAVCLGGGVVV